MDMTDTTFWPGEAQIARLAAAYGANNDKTGYTRYNIDYLTSPFNDRARHAALRTDAGERWSS